MGPSVRLNGNLPALAPLPPRAPSPSLATSRILGLFNMEDINLVRNYTYAFMSIITAVVVPSQSLSKMNDFNSASSLKCQSLNAKEELEGKKKKKQHSDYLNDPEVASLHPSERLNFYFRLFKLNEPFKSQRLDGPCQFLRFYQSQ
jgi:hypothetical protein